MRGQDSGSGGAVEAPRARRRVRRSLMAVAAGLVLLAATIGVLSWRWFVHPTVDGPIRSDAIVMFGGAGDRFGEAVSLAEDGWADVVVLSDPRPRGARHTRFGFFCRNSGSRPAYPVHDYEAICFDPETDTTRGEARYVAEMAEERGWRRIILVTTTDQATRARMLLGRCWDGEIASVVVPTDEARLGRVAYEWGAWLRANLQRRGC